MFKYFFLLFFPYALCGQGVRGHVYTDEQEPLAFTTIYIKQLETGTTTNEEGYYEIALSPGAYELVFQYLGYQTMVKPITITSDRQTLDVVLPLQTVQLKEVEIRAGREDPAYTIMRKAIAKSKFHRLQVQHYTAQVYTKGAGRVKDVPFLLEKRLQKEGVDSSTVFLSESVSEITFDQPNTVQERVISIRSIGEGNNTSPAPFINGSFYKPRVAQSISPLSPRAFAYYKFRLEGSFQDRGYEVNKIRVTPRSRGDDVFQGYIYITEDQWSIHSLNLFTYKQGFKISVQQIYSPIEEVVWLPVTHQIEATGKIFGFDLEYKYLATVSDYDIVLNPDLPIEFEVIDEKVDQELAEALIAEEKNETAADSTTHQALQQPTFTRKQLRKALRKYEKEADRQATNEPEVVSDFSITIDSLAYQKDSLYWDRVRPVPLNVREQQSYVKLDSLALVDDENENENASDGEQGVLGSLLLGTTFPLGKGQLQYRSPLGQLQFNTVEGVNLTMPLTYRMGADSIRRWEVGVVPRYAFARKKLTGKAGVSVHYADDKGRLGIEGGRFVQQFNEEEPINLLVNSLSTLLWKRNYLKIFEKDYVRLYHTQPLTPGLSLSTTVEWAERRQLFNNTKYALRNPEERVYTSNAPVNIERTDTSFPTHRALWASVRADYTPFLKYYRYNGERRAVRGMPLQLSLTYRRGFPGWLSSNIDYDLLELGVRQQVKVGVRGRLDYQLYAGSFLNNRSLYFMDFRHFLGNQVVVQESDPVGSFRLLEYYRYSTQQRYAAGHWYYQFRKLLLTRIFEVRLLGLKENVLLNYLKTDTSPHYLEAGYSLDNIFRFLRVEGVASFENGRYRDFGVRIGVSTNFGELFGF